MNNKQRKNIISNFYKIAETAEEEDDCSVSGLEFLSEDIDKTRKAIDLIKEKLETLNFDERNADTKKALALSNEVVDIEYKILDENHFWTNEETEDEYLFVLTYYIWSLESGRPITASNKFLPVLNKKDAPYYSKHELIINIVKTLADKSKGYKSLDDIIEKHDLEMIEEECWNSTINEEIGLKAQKVSEEEAEEDKEEKEEAEAAKSGKEAGRALKEEGARNRAKREQEVDEDIARREYENKKRIEQEQKEKEELLKEIRESFSPKRIEEELGLTPGSNEDDLEIQEVLRRMETTTTDPNELIKLRKLKEEAEEIEGRYTAPQNRYYEGSRSRPTGFFSSAIRRKMRLLKK